MINLLKVTNLINIINIPIIVEQTAEFHVLLISIPDGPNQKCPLRKSQPLLARASSISNHWINTLFAFGHSEHKSRQRHKGLDEETDKEIPNGNNRRICNY